MWLDEEQVKVSDEELPVVLVKIVPGVPRIAPVWISTAPMRGQHEDEAAAYDQRIDEAHNNYEEARRHSESTW